MAELSKTARASMKGGAAAQGVAEEVTLEKALKVIHGGLEAHLFIPVHFWEKVLEAYNSTQARLDSFVKGAADMDAEVRTLKAQVAALEATNQNLLKELADAQAQTATVSVVTEPDMNIEPGLEPAAQSQDSIGE
jgi:di/tripeptidase